MSITKRQENVAIGEIIFGAEVATEAIEQFAEELRKGPDGERYLLMYIRPKETPRKILGFMYEITTDFERDYTKFYHKITDMLKRRFGNGCNGWSISGPVWILE